MLRVVGTDPGSSSLDLLLLVDGHVRDQARLPSGQGANGVEALLQVLHDWEPLDLIAGPSGYGLPLVSAAEVSDRECDLMALVRDDERGGALGVTGFRSWVRALVASGLPVVFLPGGIHLPTIPAYRKVNAVDLGTADKLAVVALALEMEMETRGRGTSYREATFAVVEVGSAFTAVLVVEGGRLVDAAAGTRGPIGLRGGGAWDGEVAYLHSPLSKSDLFRGGLAQLGEHGSHAFRESLIKHVAGLRAVTPFERIWLSGSGLDDPEIAALVAGSLSSLGDVSPLTSLPGAWVKHAAQGAALLADGLAGGTHASLVESLALREASGTIWDNFHIRPAPSRA